MSALIGILFFFVLALLAAFILYFFLIRQKPKPQKKLRVKPKAKLKVKASPTASVHRGQYQAASEGMQAPKRYRYELPPGIPRDINTIRIIAQEDPNIIIDIIRKWMRER